VVFVQSQGQSTGELEGLCALLVLHRSFIADRSTAILHAEVKADQKDRVQFEGIMDA